ncbi:MAG: VTT domain-containing protein [Candidatus Nanoarchaeia archaeon]|nr:VTT domain-containing protein [Candidatus Nanoarchaeia archaeon]MDD5054170.1 VTT domain-containing protein [Candidatus Nanoarchaeia archaeon]MDD5499685.1 VTT domain-containing protein [Candidatus Nanoarchaeia archaeon]
MNFESIIEYLMELIRSSGSWGVFMGVMIESVIAPLPSPLIIMAAGFIMLPAGVPLIEIIFPLLLVITLPGAIATTLGSFIGYGIGYAGGKPLIKRFEWLLGVNWDEIDKAIDYFQKGYADELIIFLARAIPIIPLSVFSGVAGVARINAKKFALFTFLGAFLRVFILGLIGWAMGSAYFEIAQRIDDLEIIGYGVLFLLFIAGAYFIYKNRGKFKRLKKQSKSKSLQKKE